MLSLLLHSSYLLNEWTSSLHALILCVSYFQHEVVALLYVCGQEIKDLSQWKQDKECGRPHLLLLVIG